jgi:ubiquinol-cytochrome c reductase iron-sulfur subunit
VSDKPPVRRRDLLTTAAFGMTGVGAALALWPFIAALSPPADERARRIVFNLAELQANAPSLMSVGSRTVMVFRRTPEELALLRNPPEPLSERALKDSREPKSASNWHRSLRPEIAVMIATCTREPCLVKRFSADDPVLICPCCGARYDLAGRTLDGPAPRNLDVPPYAFLGDDAIEFQEFSLT